MLMHVGRAYWFCIVLHELLCNNNLLYYILLTLLWIIWTDINNFISPLGPVKTGVVILLSGIWSGNEPTITIVIILSLFAELRARTAAYICGQKSIIIA